MTTAAEIKAALRQRYCAPEWAILFEVGDATGARHTRFADALAMSLWPSRGLTLHGMEIKVSRSDWKKERENPQKAETIAAFCDYWSLVTGPGVVSDPDEIPPAWGWLEWDGKKFTRKKEETRTDAAPISRQFLAALLRRADKTNDAIIEIEVKRRLETFEEQFQDRVEIAAAHRAGRNSRAVEIVERFEAESGVKLGDGWAGNHNPATVGRALKVLLKSGFDDTFSGPFALADRLRQASDDIEKAMVENGFDKPERPKGRRY